MPKELPKEPDGPLPVLITPEQPAIPVIIEMPAGEPARPLSATQIKESGTLVTSGQGTVAAPTETEADLQVTAGQRRINIIWEITQSLIAVSITAAIVYVSVKGIDSPDLANAFFVIIGFYYSRVNHQAIGGVGRKPPQQEYMGR